jgi:hypothetical protein
MSGSGDLPAEPFSDACKAVSFVVGKRFRAGTVEVTALFIEESGRRWVQDVMRLAINNEAITNVEDDSAIIQPGATTANTIRAEDANAGLFSE